MSKNKKKKMTPVVKKSVKKAVKVAPKKVLVKQAKAVKTSKKDSPKTVSRAAAKTATAAAPTSSKTKTDKSLESVKEKLKGKKNAAAIVKEAIETVLEEEVVLTNADGQRYCRVIDCDEAAVIDGHCRLHYIMYWKRNKNKVKILEGGKLDKYIEELTQRYPDKYLEMLRKDLLTEKEFNSIIVEMDADDANDDESDNEDDGRFIDEVRGVPTTSDDDDGGF